MIKTNNVVKQQVGENWYIGGDKKRITELNYSCFNFNQNVGELEICELSSNFCYFSISEENYIKARTKNIFWNSKWQTEDGGLLKRYKRQKMNFKIAQLKAYQEFKSYEFEQFVKPNHINYSTFHFGYQEADLDKLNTDSLAAKETLEISANDVDASV